MGIVPELYTQSLVVAGNNCLPVSSLISTLWGIYLHLHQRQIFIEYDNSGIGWRVPCSTIFLSGWYYIQFHLRQIILVYGGWDCPMSKICEGVNLFTFTYLGKMVFLATCTACGSLCFARSFVRCWLPTVSIYFRCLCVLWRFFFVFFWLRTCPFGLQIGLIYIGQCHLMESAGTVAPWCNFSYMSLHCVPVRLTVPFSLPVCISYIIPIGSGL